MSNEYGKENELRIEGRDIYAIASKLMDAQMRIPSTELDPLGKNPHEKGAKLDQGKNMMGLMFSGFARALEEVGKVATYGAHKYTPNGWAEVPNGVERYTDAMLRHLVAELKGEERDVDTGLLHAAHAAWNALARLDLMLRPTTLRVPEVKNCDRP